MVTTFQVLTVVFAIAAGLIHVLIFTLESVLWARPRVWRRFGLTSQSEADTVRPMALNQGFYNLFLALAALLGVLLLLGGDRAAGVWVLVVALASMMLASIVLLATNRRLWRAALIQGGAPLLGIAALLGTVAG